MYQMDMVPAEQVAAADPFGGRGLFLPFEGASNSEIFEAMERVFGGPLPSVTWPGKGAWVDMEPIGASRDMVLARWDQR